MIVFLNVFGSVTAPNVPFERALGVEQVGWLGRNLTVDDLKPGIARRFKVIGGPLPLDSVIGLPGVRLIAMVLDDPGTRVMRQWNTAMAQENHPFHATVNAFMPREVFEQNLPFSVSLRDATTRTLSPAKGGASVEAVLERIAQGPFLIGDPEHLKPFAEALAKVMKVDPAAFGPEPFAARKIPNARGNGMPRVQAANPRDLALMEGLAAMRSGRRKFVLTRRQRPDRDAPAAADSASG